ncbi:MAG: hypothetical protein V2I57_12885 [Xanthomonadales bacterium]|jgi:hypothetical protein|nr:hypothetical protein [Xanthomonadales bacterium]
MTYRNLRGLLLAAAALTLSACGTTKVVDTWQSETIEPEAPEKVAVLVAWPDDLQRLVIERDIVAKLRDAGANAVESAELPGMRGQLTRENVEKALRNGNADGLIVVFIIGGGASAGYERADYWLQNVGTGVGGWYSPYFYDVYTVREGPGWEDRTTELMLETLYVDVRRIERVWSMVTQSEDIEYQDVAARLSDRIVKQMKRSDQI